jgi:predicted AlkP superfamily phosphohydrolase/phosphomutase
MDNRRRNLRLVLGIPLAIAGLSAALAASAAQGGADRRVIVLGFDGVDWGLTRELMAAGRLPNFSRLASTGTAQPLGTSIPPQSPVAWSNFITGMDSGGHGIFDFIHRDPKTMVPYLSTSRNENPKKFFKIGKWQVPLDSGKSELLRHGEPFWERLEANGVKCTVIRMPANYPPSGKASIELSGMGTPDILGTYGTFSFFTTDDSEFAGRKIGGGKVYKVRVRDNVVEASLYGPTNPTLIEKAKAQTDFRVYIDPEKPIVKLVLGKEERLLGEGEWTEWLPVEMELNPLQTLNGVCRFYLKKVRPVFELYATSINFDPMNPALPISNPPSFAKELAEATGGPFYTQGMPEDTKALSEGVLTIDEFLVQAKGAGDEVLRQYEWVLDRFDEGFLFYYFGNQDQTAHMMWRTMDPGHPAYDPEVHAKYTDVIPQIIERFDEIVGLTLRKMGDNTTLIVMSDHGFASWRRAMNLNTWLKEEGYLALKDPFLKDDPGLLLNVDWENTRAYGMGLNSLYVNLRGRERDGIVDPSEKRALLEEIAGKLLEAVDPSTGLRAVTKAYIAEDAYKNRGYLDIGPDMIVGYAKEMRCSNASALGEVPAEVFVDNTEEWSADHCMDHEAVPGVLFTSRPLKKPAPSLQNLAAAILAEFGIGGFQGEVEEKLESVGYISASH